MTVVVMCDGAPASIKAISWASFPGFIMQKHDGEQLILVHTWCKEVVQPRPTSRKDLSEKNAPQISEEALPLNRLPVSLVLQKTLEAINENKVVRDTLNYKIETMALNGPAAQTAAEGAHVPAKPISAKKAASVVQPNVPAESTEPSAEEVAKQAMQQRIAAIVLYARERALHHGARAIILGAGNFTDGKNVIVGLVGKAVLNTLRHEYSLWFIKNGGCRMRHSTTTLRYAVVLVPQIDSNNAIKNDYNVVEHALKCRRENTMDAVSAVVVVNNTTTTDEMNLYLQTLETLLEEANSSQNGEDEEEQTAAAAAAAQVSFESDEETALKNTQPDALVKTDETSPNAEEPNDVSKKQNWPAVSLCQLRPTKQVPEPTAAEVPGQVVKFIQRYKTDVLVLPSTLPEELHMSLLSMPKPHVLIVPSTGNNLPCASAEAAHVDESAACTD